MPENLRDLIDGIFIKDPVKRAIRKRKRMAIRLGLPEKVRRLREMADTLVEHQTPNAEGPITFQGFKIDGRAALQFTIGGHTFAVARQLDIDDTKSGRSIGFDLSETERIIGESRYSLFDDNKNLVLEVKFKYYAEFPQGVEPQPKPIEILCDVTAFIPGDWLSSFDKTFRSVEEHFQKVSKPGGQNPWRTDEEKSRFGL